MIIDAELVTGLLSLDEILRHPEKLAGQPASEIAETKIACAAVSAALAACQPAQANPAPEGCADAASDRWLTPEQAIAAHPTLTRRRLFRDNLPFVRHTSPRKIEISEQGLKKWIERNAGEHRASPPLRACRVR